MRSRRWPRLVVPLAVAALLLVVSAVTHALQTPDPADRAYLNPDSSAPIGGRDLADRLRADGIAVVRVDTSPDALLRARQGNVTLFVPAPSMMDPGYLGMLGDLPASTRVVLVAPSLSTLDQGGVPVLGAVTRWATATADPACAMPEAAGAGRAAIAGTRYRTAAGATLVRCYAGALVGVRMGPADVLLAGASDPFRNDRIGEYHNAALSTRLLGTRRTVVWLDLHRHERAPGPSPSDAGSPGPDSPLSGGRGASAGTGAGGAAPGGGASDGGAAGGGLGSAPNSLWSDFPAWMWASLGLMALVALVLALAFGRRLGPPVGEPLPVVVPAAETVAGRGRLYRRARARGPALDALRAAALDRLRHAFDLPADAPHADVVAAVAARTGRAPGQVEEILYGPEPENDKALVRAVDDLDALAHRALGYPDGGARTVGPLRPATPQNDVGGATGVAPGMPAGTEGQTR